MIELPQSANHPDVVSGSPGTNPCIVCGAEIIAGKEAGLVHLGEGGGSILEIGEKSPSGFDEDGEGGMGWHYIGKGCARKHGIGRKYLG